MMPQHLCSAAGDMTTESQFYITVNEQNLFASCFPNLVADFQCKSGNTTNAIDTGQHAQNNFLSETEFITM